MKHPSDPHYFEVLLPLPFDTTFTYVAERDLQIARGCLVYVPFKKKKLYGVVWKVNQPPPRYPVREILCCYDELIISNGLLSFIEQFSQYNLCKLGLSLKNTVHELSLLAQAKGSCPTLENNTNVQTKPLSEAQQSVFELIKPLLNGYHTILVDGKTGSGKTAVYIQSIVKILQDNPKAQILVLTPEITLVDAIKNTMTQQCAAPVLIWHSAVSRAERLKTLHHVSSQHSCVVVGTRSALFLPFQTLRCLVIDEEHDSSYKQDHHVIYHARDMGILLGYVQQIPVLLISATPCLETMYNAQNGRYITVHLPYHYHATSLPQVTVVDMKREKHLISYPLQRAILSTIQNKKQVLLFLNRRGYCQLTLCTSCGHKIQCPNCQTWLVEHVHHDKYLCHYCDYQREAKQMTQCPNCQKLGTLKRFGTGAERIYEAVKTLFPQYRALLVTSDTTGHERTSFVQQILDQQIDIIVGTQLLAKGHNFPNLSLVGIIDTDICFTGIDLRASERTYQTLHQVLGRTGRFDTPSRILIQTHYPESLLIRSLSTFDRQLFYHHELHGRIATHMPPLTRMISLTISSLKEHLARRAAHQLALHLREKFQHYPVTLLGASPAPIPYLKRRYRYQILFRAQKTFLPQATLKRTLQHFKISSSVRLKIDVDPLHFY